MTALLSSEGLSPLERLCLRTGQLAFPGPGREARAVGLCLAIFVSDPAESGLTGNGILPEHQTIREAAGEIIHEVNLTGHRLHDALEVLRISGFLVCKDIDPGERYMVRPSTLPQRRTHPSDQSPGRLLLDGVEIDVYGFGDC